MFRFDGAFADISYFEGEEVTSHGPIQSEKLNIRQECYSLPEGFCWDTLDLENAEQVSWESFYST